jgi:hypothetical protein
LNSLEHDDSGDRPPSSEEGVDWTDQSRLRLSGVDPDWLAGLADPGEFYLHIDTVTHGDWRLVSRYLDLALLSPKQRDVLFPLLKRARPPSAEARTAADGSPLAEECQRLNGLLQWARESGMTWRVFGRYQKHVNIHGASQNVAARIGEIGARIAIMEALTEAAPDTIADVYGDEIPGNVRHPIELYEYLYGTGQKRDPVRALLLKDGRGVVFTSDPDVAIFQSLGSRYRSAEQALRAWESVRRDVRGRSQKVHVFAEGEIKTATDRGALHERLALGSRETREEVRTDRFLLMAILVEEIFRSTGSARRKKAGLTNKDVNRFSDVFNLYVAWGYGGLRERHPDHWDRFKTRLTTWCLE